MIKQTIYFVAVSLCDQAYYTYMYAGVHVSVDRLYLVISISG